MATGDITLKYSASSSALTCTLISLAASSARQSFAYSNSASNFTDAMLVALLHTTSGTHADAFACYIHGYASADATNWSNPITTSTDIVTVITTGMNLFGPWVVNFGTSVTGLYQTVTIIPSLANFFGGQLPAQFGFVIENHTNIALSTTGANQALTVWPLFENVST